jgi:hypothetical protein
MAALGFTIVTAEFRHFNFRGSKNHPPLGKSVRMPEAQFGGDYTDAADIINHRVTSRAGVELVKM